MPKRLVRRLAVLLSVAIAVPPVHAATVLGADTPQALVDRMMKAGEEKNLAEMVACLEPQGRVEMSMGLVAATTMMVAFMGMGADMATGMAEATTEAASGKKMSKADKAKLDKQKKEAAAKIAKSKAALSAIFKKNGLPDFLDEKVAATLPEDKDAAMKMMNAVDHPALVADLMKFMDTFGDKKEGAETPSAPQPPLPVTAGMTVKDYKIKGDMATAKAGKEKLEFVRVDGRWLMKLPEKKEDKKKDDKKKK
jgi:hypothetical protein